MTTQNTTTTDKTDRDEIVDISIKIGQLCWDVYCHSKTGFVRVLLLPSAEVRRRANELFQLGEHAVPSQTELPLHFSDPLPLGAGVDERNNVERIIEGEADRPSASDLDGPVYPDTPDVVLDYAQNFFHEGFRAGTVAVNEILNS